MDHSRASVRRYTGLNLTRVPEVPAGMALDGVTRELFISDTGANRIVRVLTDSGHFARDAKVSTPTFEAYAIYSSPEPAFVYSIWDGLTYSSYASVPTPSGLAITSTTLYAASHSNGHIYAFRRATGILLDVVRAAPTRSLLGLAIAPPSLLTSTNADGSLFYIDGSTHSLGHVALSGGECDASSAATAGDGTCTDGVISGEESGVDCGGRVCARCADGVSCGLDSDCASSRCDVYTRTCAPAIRAAHSSSFLANYLNSDYYRSSFAHHMINGDMGGASYLNPYPIMAADFCSTVGVDNATGVVNCSSIDYDSLLLGGCWCHECLPENPCLHGGRCDNFNGQGYTCNCSSLDGARGDHCQLSNSLPGEFPWYAIPLPPPPASPPTPPAVPPPPATPPPPTPPTLPPPSSPAPPLTPPGTASNASSTPLAEEPASLLSAVPPAAVIGVIAGGVALGLLIFALAFLVIKSGRARRQTKTVRAGPTESGPDALNSRA